MGRKFLKPEQLQRGLEPQGFRLNLPEPLLGGISFVRRSSVDRLYEHLRISAKNPVYAETLVSAATFASGHACVSETDDRLRSLLSGETWYRSTSLTNFAEARCWTKKLLENADQYCSMAAIELGPALLLRLQPACNAVDRYVQRLDDLSEIFDRENAFLTEGTQVEQSKIERLADLAQNMLYLNPADARLASATIVRFASEIEGTNDPFGDCLPQRDAELARRLILIADHVNQRRREYDSAGGLFRQQG